MAQDWKAAIAKYEADIADGTIKFGAGMFADSYPGQEAQEAELAGFVREHTITGTN